MVDLVVLIYSKDPGSNLTSCKGETWIIKKEYRNSFGANFRNQKTEQELKNGMVFLDEGDPQLFLLYPVGRHLGIRDVRENITQSGNDSVAAPG